MRKTGLPSSHRNFSRAVGISTVSEEESEEDGMPVAADFAAYEKQYTCDDCGRRTLKPKIRKGHVRCPECFRAFLNRFVEVMRRV